MTNRQLKKKPRLVCRYCGSPAKFDVRDEVTGVLYGLMCLECCDWIFKTGYPPKISVDEGGRYETPLETRRDKQAKGN